MPIAYKFLIIDMYYPKFLSSLYSKFPELGKATYTEQMDFIMGQCFGTADFYSKNLKTFGCEAEEIIANNEILQRRWALENGLKLNASLLCRIRNKLPLSRRIFPGQDVLLTILEAQIKKSKPDVLYLQSLYYPPPSFLQRIRRYIRLIVGQIACPLPPKDYLTNFDLILTSFPHYVERFRKMGIKSEYFKISFEPAILEKIKASDRKYSCTFVGGISPAHKKGTQLLEELAQKTEIDFFGYGAETLDSDSPILSKHHGEVWGLDMYRALLSSKITLNRHIDVAENYANNMRLYEATGCGAMLITDRKDNLDELFQVGKEVVAYRTVDELIELISYYSINQAERERVAKAGQMRTLSEYTYYNRMGELIEIISNTFK
jgi:spore maturation protein CgeB